MRFIDQKQIDLESDQAKIDAASTAMIIELNRITGIDSIRHHELALNTNYPLYKTLRIVTFSQYVARFTVQRMRVIYWRFMVCNNALLNKYR